MTNHAFEQLLLRPIHDVLLTGEKGLVGGHLARRYEPATT
jgi:hypothetical protein